VSHKEFFLVVDMDGRDGVTCESREEPREEHARRAGGCCCRDQRDDFGCLPMVHRGSDKC
jgi:hypothetical protein